MPNKCTKLSVFFIYHGQLQPKVHYIWKFSEYTVCWGGEREIEKKGRRAAERREGRSPLARSKEGSSAVQPHLAAGVATKTNPLSLSLSRCGGGRSLNPFDPNKVKRSTELDSSSKCIRFSGRGGTDFKYREGGGADDVKCSGNRRDLSNWLVFVENYWVGVHCSGCHRENWVRRINSWFDGMNGLLAVP